MVIEQSLQNHFLLAMPGMEDERFARTVIYLCAHTNEGAMGLVVNRSQPLMFSDVVVDIGLFEKEDAILLPETARNFSVRNGGPVDRSRGFILHSPDYHVESSMQVSDDVSLTATLDILRAISEGQGPSKAFMALGYSGWDAGQLETEISENSWLAFPATSNLVFESRIETIYDRVLASMGIDARFLSTSAGHA